jgi:hypothetical protein
VFAGYQRFPRSVLCYDEITKVRSFEFKLYARCIDYRLTDLYRTIDLVFGAFFSLHVEDADAARFSFPILLVPPIVALSLGGLLPTSLKNWYPIIVAVSIPDSGTI